MKKVKKHLVIARSNNKRFSSLSQISCDALVLLLSKYYEKVTVKIVNNRQDLNKLVLVNPDIVFLGLSVVPEIDGGDVTGPDVVWLSEYLDQKNIAYTGSGVFAHKLERNKALAKTRVFEEGLETSKFFISSQASQDISQSSDMSFPMFVKPLDRGGGAGIDSFSVVRNNHQLKNKITDIAETLLADSLVEEYLEGREFSVAILRKDTGEYLAMPIELIAPEDEFGSRVLSNTVKLNDTEAFLEVKDKTLKNEISSFALEIFFALGARDYGRVDIRLDSFGIPHFLEANLIPSMIENYGNFPKACLVNEGLSYETIVTRIISLASERQVHTATETGSPALPMALAV